MYQRLCTLWGLAYAPFRLGQPCVDQKRGRARPQDRMLKSLRKTVGVRGASDRSRGLRFHLFGVVVRLNLLRRQLLRGL
jgi:hypothetical protein